MMIQLFRKKRKTEVPPPTIPRVGTLKHGAKDLIIWQPYTAPLHIEYTCCLRSCRKPIGMHDEAILLEDEQTEYELCAVFHLQCFKTLLEGGGAVYQQLDSQ